MLTDRQADGSWPMVLVFVRVIDAAEIQMQLNLQATLHLQIYGYNDLHRQAIQGLMGPFHRLFGLPTNALLERLELIGNELETVDAYLVSLSILKRDSGKEGLRFLKLSF